MAQVKPLEKDSFMEKAQSDGRMGQDVPKSEKSRPRESYFPQPLRYNARRRPVCTPGRGRQVSRHCRERPVRTVKEQASDCMPRHWPNAGSWSLRFDPSYTGESGGEPRYVASPDINTEDFLRCVDYLATRDEVDETASASSGICGFGGFALNAAAIDTRIKATVASTMYDMAG